jgi:hypothetical protein
MAFPFDPPELLGRTAAPPPEGAVLGLVAVDEARPPSDAPRPGNFGRASRDARALKILAKTIHRELRQSGLVAEDVMTIASELLSLVTADVRERRRGSGG